VRCARMVGEYKIYILINLLLRIAIDKNRFLRYVFIT